jgi:hypothetical protein
MVDPAFQYYVLGRMPQDAFRGKDMLTKDQFDAGGPYAAKALLANAYNASGAGSIIGRMKTEDVTQVPPGLVEKVLTAPFVGPTVGRFVRVIGGGRQEDIRQEDAPIIQASARTREDVRLAMELANQGNGRMPDWAAKRFVEDYDFAQYYTSLQRQKMEEEALTPEQKAFFRSMTRATKVQAATRMMNMQD